MKKEIGLENLLNEVDYKQLEKQLPSIFALKFINVIKLINDGKGEENKTPTFHYDMLNQLTKHKDNLFIAFRGSAKTSLLSEYMILYLALFNSLPLIDDINLGIYISDTMENGVKNMRRNLEHRYNNSKFLQKFVPKARFTESEWEFTNINNKQLLIKGFAAQTGFRGVKGYNTRPQICILDDLMSDKNAQSPTITEDIKNIIYKAARAALHPTKRMFIWTGTPFNKKDPLYQAAASKAWNTKVYPICEKFPCDYSEFKGAWEDRFDYAFIAREYNMYKESGMISAFNQELMLRIMSDDDRLVLDSDIKFIDIDFIEKDIDRVKYNYFITTDFATSEKQKADFNVISVWTYTKEHGWILIDGMLRRCKINEMIDEIFKFSDKYKPIGVVIEVSGVQKGFGDVLEQQMIDRHKFFPLYKEDNRKKEEGVISSSSKLVRFNSVLPLFKQNKIKFNSKLKYTPILNEGLEELSSITNGGIKSAHDDFIDTVSQIAKLVPISENIILENNEKDKKVFDNSVYYNYNNELNEEELTGYSNYI